MKLSEAIRQGAALHPQAFGAYVTELLDGTVCTCTLGAAYEGLTGELPPMQFTADALPGRFTVDWALRQQTDAPDTLLLEIVRLNDDEAQPREQIADWAAALGY